MKNMFSLLLVSAAVLALAACDVKVDSDMPVDPSFSSGTGPSIMPENLLGSWTEEHDYGSGIKTKIQIVNTKEASGLVSVSYFNDCGNGSEAFTGTVTFADSVSDPAKWATRITSVTPFEGGCSNVMALDTTDVGRFVNCIGEKTSLTATAFEISCVLSTYSNVFPANYNEGDIHAVK